MCVSVLSCVQLFATLWTVTHQASRPLASPARILEWVAVSSSMGFSQPRIKPMSPVAPALADEYFTTSISDCYRITQRFYIYLGI